MQLDRKAFSRYMNRKIDLEELLRQREVLLRKLVALVQTALYSSSVSNPMHLDVIQSQELLVSLAELETKIVDLVTEINTYAEQSGEAPVKMRTHE